VFIASDVPERHAIVTLVQNNTPKARLCGLLEFAKPNMVAAAMYNTAHMTWRFVV
jgi:hypothetical protein